MGERGGGGGALAEDVPLVQDERLSRGSFPKSVSQVYGNGLVFFRDGICFDFPTKKAALTKSPLS